MTETERATKLIERIERLFERAKDKRIHRVKNESDRGYYLFADTLRNVGLEGIVGPVRTLMEIEESISEYPNALCLASIVAWCDRWEPVLDREEPK